MNGFLPCAWLLGITAVGALVVDEAPPLPEDPGNLVLTTAASVPGLPDGEELNDSEIALGRRLFFDPVLSRDGTVSCASCHRPDHGFATPDALTIGIEGRVGRRNAPSLFNRDYGTRMFWDGRAETLEAQVLEPLSNPVEFDHSLEAVLAALRADADYASAFADVFAAGGARAQVRADDLISADRLAAALAAFVRSLRLGDSPVDRFQSGDYSALTAAERQGLWLFESRGGCWQCHGGRNYTDESFHHTGLRLSPDEADHGRFEATGDEQHRGQFKTPSLRGVALSPPYMHDGRFKTLREVVEFYNGGGDSGVEGVDARIEPLGLVDDEIDQLVAFMEALSRRADVDPKR